MRSPSLVCALSLSLSLSLVAHAVHAQQATADAPPPTNAPPAEGPPSETLANALRMYQQERYEEARTLFASVFAGNTQDAPANRQKAEFFIGKSNFHLARYRESLAIFERITRRGDAHIYFTQTLQWLGQLHPRVGTRLEATVITCVGRYDERTLAIFDTPDAPDREQLAVLRYLLGRARFQQHRYHDARRLLEAVPEGTRVSAAAQRWAARARATVGPM